MIPEHKLLVQKVSLIDIGSYSICRVYVKMSENVTDLLTVDHESNLPYCFITKNVTSYCVWSMKL